MKKQIFLILGLVLLLAAKVYAYDDGDFQVWNTDVQDFKINKDLKASFEEEFRWADNSSEFYYHHYDAGLIYTLSKHLNFGAGYRHIYELKTRKFKAEKSPYLTLSLLWDLSGFKFEDRSRLEYRNFGYQADSGRYRNKLTVKLPWKFTKMEIQPYLSDEVFFGIGGTNQFNQNRFSSGIGMNLAKNVKLEVYYMLQNAKSKARWPGTNVLGTKVKMSF